jgi:pimeloyl-ACP methyl ester carboxylesterase
VASGFSVDVAGGSIVGWETGAGTPLLVLHGGPLTDNTESLVELLPAGIRAIRYQQRGLPPSTLAAPLDIEAHVADAISVLDDCGCEQAWLLGHSWGGHLAAHIAVAHPERVLGVIAVDALGTVPDGGWGALDTNLFSRLERDSPEDAERARILDERAMAGLGTDEDAAVSLALVWPYYFADPHAAPPMPHTDISVPLYSAVVDSVLEHFRRGTLEQGLASFDKPFALIHGEHDPLPVDASRATAALVPGATLEVIPETGHLPWLEAPEEFRAALARALTPAL